MKDLYIKDICIKGSSNLKQKDLLESGIYPVYGASGMAGYLNTYQQESDYIAIVKDGSGIGRVSFQEGKSSLIGTMQYILPKKGFDIKYIGYCLQSLDLSKYKQGAAIPHIYFRDYGERIVKVSDDIKEQQRIVSRLDAAFSHIDEIKSNAEKQLTETRALFQKSLAKAIKPKKGWKEKKLSEIAQVRIGPFGSLLHKKDYISGGIPLVNPIHMIRGKIYANKDFTISVEKANELSNYILKTNDIIFARRGEIGRCALVSRNEEGFLCGTGSLFVRFNVEVDYKFLLMLFLSDYCKDYLENNATGATMLNINSGIIENMPVVLPSISEQQRIVERLDALSALVRELEENQKKIISECDALKQALLRKVFK